MRDAAKDFCSSSKKWRKEACQYARNHDFIKPANDTDIKAIVDYKW